MTTQYTSILKLALPVQGELSGTWGDVVNDNITSMVEQAIAGRAVINSWTANAHTLTTANGVTSESRCAMLEFTDSGNQLTGAGSVICPTLSKIYIAKNASGQNVTLKTSGGTGILVPNGRTMFLFCDGTNVVEAVTSTTSLQLGTSTTVTAVLDEDNMASNSAVSLATQQSIKAYVDAQVATSDTLAEVLANGNTTGGTDVSVSTDDKVQFRDAAIYINSSADGQLDIVADTEIQIAATTIDVNGILDVSGNIVAGGTVDGRDVATDGTKLDGIEASADVTDTANVTAAGALMDSEVTNLAQVKAFDSSDYATAAQGTLAAAALPKAGGAMTGAITTNSTFDGRDVATDGTKLDGIEASADVTDATNVTAAGALMDSEVTNLAQVKAFDSSDYATAAQGTTADAALPKAGGTMSGAIAMGTSKITGAGNPTAAQDVATKAYVDSQSGGGETLQQTLAIGNTTTTDTKIQFRDTGLYINSSADGQLDIVADTEVQIAATTVDVNGILDVSGNIVAGGTVDGRDIATDGTKLDGIEASADVTDATNVTAAGALMDSEVTNLAQVKAFASSDYATAAQGTLAAAALPKTGGAMTGAITTNSTFDGRDVAADGVTADAALPKSGGAMTGAITTNSTFDGRDVATDGTKLDGIEASADVTDTTNVVASLTAGSNITIAADGTIASTASGGGETLQQTLAIGNTTTTDTKIQFRDTAIYINSSVDGQLDIVADTEVQLAATTFDINAAVVTNGDVTVGDDLSLLSDGSKINFGLNSDVSLTHQHNLGLLLNGTRYLYFNDTSQYIHASDSTRLKMGATTEIELNAALIDVNGALDVSGNIVVAGTVDGRDVAADGVTADAALPKAGGTMTGALTSGSDGTGHDVKFFGDTAGHYMLYDASTDNLNLVGVGSSLSVGGSLVTDPAGNLAIQSGANFFAAITEDSDTLSGSGAVTINLNNATNWLHDLSGNTTYTFTYPTTTNVQVSSSFTLKIIQGTTARTITWPSSVDWAGGTAPTLSTANNAVDVFVFYTIDSGTTWYGFTAGQAMA